MSLENVRGVRIRLPTESNDLERRVVEVIPEDGTTVDDHVRELFEKHGVTDKAQVTPEQARAYGDLKAGNITAEDWNQGKNPHRGEDFEPPRGGR